MRPLLLAIVVLAGCARVPLDVAEEQCFRAQMRGGSDTRVTIGIGDNWGGTGVALSTDVPLGSTDPEIAYATCVQRRAGQPPITPFRARLGLPG